MSASRSFFSIRTLNNSFPAFHGVRVIAMLIVVFSHLSPKWGLNPNLSMDVFFALSGFLIAKIIFSQMDADSSTTVGGLMNRFYVRRAIRTVPIYYLTLLLFFAFRRKAGPWDWWVEFGFLSNYARHDSRLLLPAGWSLSVEEHFYLLAPLICFVFMKKLKTHAARAKLLLAMIATFMAIHFLSFFAFSVWHARPLDEDERNFLQNLVNYATLIRMPELLMGMATAYFFHYCPDDFRRIFVDRNLWRRLIAVIGYGGSLLVFFDIPPLGSVSHFKPVGDVWGFFVVCIFIHLLSSNDRIVRFLSQPAFLPLATISYSAFLIHGMAIRLVMYSPLPGIWSPAPLLVLRRFVFVVVLAFVLAYVMHLFIEKPCLAFRDKFFPDTSRKREPISGAVSNPQELVLQKT